MESWGLGWPMSRVNRLSLVTDPVWCSVDYDTILQVPCQESIDYLLLPILFGAVSIMIL